MPARTGAGATTIDERSMTETADVRNQATMRRLRRLLAAFGTLRTKERLAAEEALIFFALGQLAWSSGEGAMSKLVPCAEISELLGIPRETVRRKAGRLVDLELATLTPRGLRIRDNPLWTKVVRDVLAGM